MTTDAVLAIDAGTTGITALVVDHDGRVVAGGYREFPQHYPRAGWVEHDPEQIWRATCEAVDEAVEAADARVVALGIANQRETFLFWDRRTGRPLYNAIVWQCRRSAAICDELRTAGIEEEVRRKTGLRLDPYFSGTKALWLLRARPEIAAALARGDALFGTVDTWLIWRLSGGALHVTDWTNASRTLLFDIDRLDWDDGLLRTFGLARAAMPRPSAAAAVRGETIANGRLPGGVVIAGIAGDQQAALFGQACLRPGEAKATYGTGCFILMNTGPRRIDAGGGLLTTVAATADGSAAYALEGSVFIAGAAVQWLRDNMGFIKEAAEADGLAASVSDSDGVVFVPAFVGLGTPHWGPDARGAIYGLTRGTRPAHIARAALEAIAFQAQDVIDLMVRGAGLELNELRVDGGAANSAFVMQLQADLAGAPLSRPESVESTGLGAAFLAGLAAGFWKDAGEVAGLRRESRRFLPSPDRAPARAGLERWRAAVSGLLRTELAPYDSAQAQSGNAG